MNNKYINHAMPQTKLKTTNMDEMISAEKSLYFTDEI